MVRLEGKLTVKHVNGKRGVFSVGTLNTGIGEFKVKDAVLDQYLEGVYDGEFVVSRIFNEGYHWRGSFITELRATLDSVKIKDADEKPIPQGEAEPDPAAELKAEDASPAKVEAEARSQPPVEAPASDAATAVSDSALFGVELYEMFVARRTVKLDPAIGADSASRTKFREQRDRLKAVGYRFDSVNQSWSIKQ